MVNQDFIRQFTNTSHDIQKRDALWSSLHIDPPLLVALLVLATFGLMVLYSASGLSVAETQRQASAFAVGFLCMLIVAQLDVHFIRGWTPLMYSGGIALLGLVLVMGVELNGAKSWLDLPGLPSFQPSEVVKFVLPMLLAWYLGSRTLPPRLKHLFWAAIMIVIPVALIVLQNDMGTAIMVMMSGVFVLFLAGIRWSYVFAGVGAGVLASPAWWIFLALPHQKNRILTFFDPDRDPMGAGYNIIQSQIAIGSGGVFGKGWQMGAQSRLDFIPESNTDFILAVLAEEFGLVGVVFLCLLYLIILVRGMFIAVSAPDMFCRLFAGSIILTFFFYLFVNMAMVSGLLPVIGLPLPLISHGGTSIVMFMIGFGFLMSIHTHRRRAA